jgi:multidrug efflux pump subunit AcrA (membrane-fusion protein)
MHCALPGNQSGIADLPVRLRLARSRSWLCWSPLEPLVRRAAAAAAVLEARNNTVPAVRTFVVQEELHPRTIDLPGSMAAFDSAKLYARATGYVSVRNADIGTKVHKGDVLAVIAAPDLDQQLAQAKAQLLQLEAAVRQAQANADLGRVTNQQTSRLVAQGWSAQQGDTDRLTFDARTAALSVAQANVAAHKQR